MKRIALIDTWGDPYTDYRVGGILHAINYLADDLTAKGYYCHKFFFSNKKKPDKNWDKSFMPLSDNQVGRLNKYDLVIFATSGHVNDKKLKEDDKPIWQYHLEDLKKPFFLQNHGEADWDKFTRADKFLLNPLCKLLMPVAEGLFKNIKGLEQCKVPQFVYPCYSLLNQPNPENYYDQKVERIITASRMTSRKRTKELVEQDEVLHKAGFEIHLHGAHSSYFYIKAMEEASKGYYKLHNEFTPEDLDSIMGPAKFLWQPFCYKQKNKVTCRRLELPPIEAAFRGCVPILQRSTVPEFVDDDCALLIDVFDLKDLPERLKEYSVKFKQVNKNFIERVKENQGHNLRKLINLIEAATL